MGSMVLISNGFGETDLPMVSDEVKGGSGGSIRVNGREIYRMTLIR